MDYPTLTTDKGTADSNRFKDGITPLRRLRFDRRNAPQKLFSNAVCFGKTTWLDQLAIFLIGAATFGISYAPHTFTRLIPVSGPSGDIYWPEIAYPYIEPMFSSILTGVLAAAVPIIVILVSQLYVQSFDDFAYGLLGLSYATMTGTLFQIALKKTIGGLRPHFLAVCEPLIPSNGENIGAGFQNTMWTSEQICTGDEKMITDALESFPSGHSEAAFAGFGYLAIYLFAHLKIRSVERKRAGYWRMLLVIAPLLFATYLASTMVLGYHHHGYDVVFGALIGWVMALFGYRMVFRGVWDPDWNTIPVVREVQHGEEGEPSMELQPQERETV